VNVHISDVVDDSRRYDSSKLTLTHQLQRLLVCIDVYLETFEPKPLNASTNDFCQERICSRLTRSTFCLFFTVSCI